MIWDGRKKQRCKTGSVAVRVRHPSYPGALWVVIVRGGGEAWYLVTTRWIETEAQAWECSYAYCRRWQVETVFRFEKSELAIETIRVWKREKRNKVFHLVSLVHCVLFHLLAEE
jgi:DDE family transposase